MKSRVFGACIILEVSFVSVQPASAGSNDLTLSKRALLALDWQHYSNGVASSPPAIVIARRNIPGPGVEFDIQWPGSENQALYFYSSRNGGAGCLAGYDVSAYDHYTLQFTYVSVDGGSAGSSHAVWVGTPIDGGYQNVFISPGQSRVSSTPISFIGSSRNIGAIGWNIFRSSPGNWSPGPHTIRLRVEPVPGAYALFDGPLSDCNGNVTPDACEPDEDCNINGVRDICDLANGIGADCDSNGHMDACEPSLDCNLNAIADRCDLAAGASSDCNENGHPDECDLAEGTSLDENESELPDECELGACCREDTACSRTIDIHCPNGNWTPGAGCKPNPCLCCAAPGECFAGCDLTLSDAELMTLDWHDYGGPAPANPTIILAKRDVPGPGVEFDIHFPTRANDLVSYFSSQFGGSGCLAGRDIAMYENLILQFTYVAVDGGLPANPNGMGIWFGISINGSYRNEPLRPGETSYESIAIGSGSADQYVSIGFNVFRSIPNNWSPTGNTITVRVQAFPETISLVVAPYEDCNENGRADWCDAGDFMGDGVIQLLDFSSLVDCMNGPEAGVSRDCCTVFELDHDADVDLRDTALWLLRID